MTNTTFSVSKYPEKWVKNIEFMIEGVTFTQDIKIHISTAFYWRHKILKAIFKQLEGIVERD